MKLRPQAEHKHKEYTLIIKKRRKLKSNTCRDEYLS